VLERLAIRHMRDRSCSVSLTASFLTAAGKGENGTVWSTLQTLVWCPVLAEPPAAGMPWPPSELPLLSPPKLVRSPGWQVDRACCSSVAPFRPLCLRAKNFKLPCDSMFGIMGGRLVHRGSSQGSLCAIDPCERCRYGPPVMRGWCPPAPGCWTDTRRLRWRPCSAGTARRRRMCWRRNCSS